VYIDSFHILAIHIAAKMRTFVYHQTRFAGLLGTVSERRSKQA
jgi:hypothetical protein